jgi:hypothetical protein
MTHETLRAPVGCNNRQTVTLIDAFFTVLRESCQMSSPRVGTPGELRGNSAAQCALISPLKVVAYASSPRALAQRRSIESQQPHFFRVAVPDPLCEAGDPNLGAARFEAANDLLIRK